MLPKDIREQIIKPTLEITGLWSLEAEILVYGTGWVESDYLYKEQIGNPKNGGLGYWQDEPSDYTDLCSWLNGYANKAMLDRVLSACYYTVLPSDPRVLISNLKLACLFCRIHYLRIKQQLPPANDARKMAMYHKSFYNSALGAADVDKNTIIFQEVIDGKR